MNILVAGLGISGKAVLHHLSSDEQHKVFAYDSRIHFDTKELENNYPLISFICGDLPDSWRDMVDLVVLSPGLDPRTEWIQDFYRRDVTVIGEIELFCLALKPYQQVIAITGSNGKSTVTTLVGELLLEAGVRCKVGGNLGTPALELLSDDVDVYVLELSSFQLETTLSLNAVSATILNISPDHLDRYDSMSDYIAAKSKIYQMTKLAIINRDDPIASIQCPTDVRRISFGLSEPITVHDFGILAQDDGHSFALVERCQEHNYPWFMTHELKLSGRHHWANVLAALALCSPFSLSDQVVDRVLSRFAGLDHRTQRVADNAGVVWINDSKGTNVGATLSAINSIGIDSPLILLAGGQGKGQDFSPLYTACQRYVKALIVFGEDGQQIADACNGACQIHQVPELSQAVFKANELALEGDVVLLSPACASFDQFKNYADRGEQFKHLVAELSC